MPSGFVLVGGHLADYRDTNENVPDDGSAIPNIPDGLSQPNGAGGILLYLMLQGEGIFHIMKHLCTFMVTLRQEQLQELIILLQT